MKKNNALKICAIISMILVPFPLIIMFDGAAFDEISYLRYLIYFAVAFIPIVTGYFIKRLRSAQLKPKRVFLVNLLLCIITVALCVICCIVIDKINEATGYSFPSHYLCFAFIPSIVVWTYLGLKLHKTSFSDIFTFLWLGVFITETFFCYIASVIMEVDHPLLVTAKSNMVILLVIVALLTVLLINQTNIETQINQRKNTSLIVPKGLRSYNAMLIMLVGIFILAALLLKDPLSAFLTWLVITVFRIIDALLYAIPIDSNTSSSGDTEITMPGETVTNGGNDILIFIVLTVLIVLLIVFRKQIFAGIKKIAQRIFGKFSVPEAATDDTLGYTDTYEMLDQNAVKIKKDTDKDCLKKYKKENDLTEKFRLGYRLYLMWLKNHSKADIATLTVEEQKKLSARVYHGNSDIVGISDSYTGIRYGDKSAKQDSSIDMDKLIDELYK